MDALSKYLRHQIDFLDEELTAEELADYSAERELLLDSVEQLARCKPENMYMMYGALRKAANKIPAELIREIGDSAAWSLDDCLSRLLVSEIPRMVTRAMSLEAIFVDKNASRSDSPYLREGTRCYLFGLFTASVALCRTALEKMLSTKVPVALQRGQKGDSLSVLAKAAELSILKRTPRIVRDVNEVRTKANSIVSRQNLLGA